MKFFPKLGDNSIIQYVKRGLESKHSAILIAALTVISNWFSLELPVYYSFAAFVLLATLLCDDLRCLIPMACCFYYPFSRANGSAQAASNPNSIFTNLNAQIQLGAIIVFIAIALITRLVFDLVTKPERRRLPKLTWGFIAVGIGYVLGGLCSPYFALNTVLYGFAQIFSLCFAYLFFYFTVDFKNIDKSYFAYVMTVVGVLLCFEMLGILYFSGCLTTEGAFSRGNLYTGWGVYNNVACALAMSLAAPFYYATTKKNGWIYLILGNVFYVFILFTQSRGGIVFGSCCYVLSLAVMLWKAKKKKTLLFTQFCIFAITAILCLTFKGELINIFNSMLDKGMDDSGRFDIYWDGWELFKQSPIFGTGFYSYVEAPPGTDLGDLIIIPLRHHNTIIQLLASCGIVGFAAYVYHRCQTLAMVFKKRNVEKYFIGICILGVLLTSLLDVHIFNFHPCFTYAILLLCLEVDCLRDTTVFYRRLPRHRRGVRLTIYLEARHVQGVPATHKRKKK